VHDLPARLDGWREEEIEFLVRLVNHDSGTDDVMGVNHVGVMLAVATAPACGAGG
jgi:hypothetical protein